KFLNLYHMYEEKITSVVGSIKDLDKIFNTHFKLEKYFTEAVKLGMLVDYQDEFFIGDNTVTIIYTVKKPLF
ncbi:MAG TPA: hypothetical protein VIK84_01235, partial [Haloplasmataceae bacterium]